MTKYSETYDLDLQIAENNGITLDMVDEIPLYIVEIIRRTLRNGHDINAARSAEIAAAGAVLRINLLRGVAKQFATDVASGDYTAIDELLKNIPEDRLKGFLSEQESEPQKYMNR
jgi:hypothetical protein